MSSLYADYQTGLKSTEQLVAAVKQIECVRLQVNVDDLYELDGRLVLSFTEVVNVLVQLLMTNSQSQPEKERENDDADDDNAASSTDAANDVIENAEAPAVKNSVSGVVKTTGNTSVVGMPVSVSGIEPSPCQLVGANHFNSAIYTLCEPHSYHENGVVICFNLILLLLKTSSALLHRKLYMPIYSSSCMSWKYVTI